MPRRRRQREAIRRAAERVYDEIPEAPPRRRKRKRPRLAAAEVETHRKAADTHLRYLAQHLPPAEAERLLDDPGELRQWWLEVRAEMNALCGVNSPQPSDGSHVDKGGGQIVHPPIRMSRTRRSQAQKTLQWWTG